MASSSTKSIAARLPLDEYVRVLTNATEAKLSVSDYIILQLDAGKRAGQAEAEKRALTQQVRQLQQESQQKINLANEKELDLKREMINLQQQADMNQQNWQKALEKARVQLGETTKTAGNWQTHANNLQQTNTVLEQTIKTNQQRLAQEQDQLVKLKAQNGSLTLESRKWQQESSAVKAELAALTQQAFKMLDELSTLHDESRISYIPNRYWPILDEFRECLKAMSSKSESL